MHSSRSLVALTPWLVTSALALSTLGAACSSDRQSSKTEDDVEVSVSQPSASTSASSTGEPIARRPPEIEFAFPTHDGPAIGQACPSPEDPDCGRDNRVSIEHSRDRFGRAEVKLPCDLTPLTPSNASPYHYSACVIGDHLLVVAQCLYCRMPSNDYAHARISMMTAKQHASLLQSLQIEAPAPASAQEWSKLIQEHQRKDDPLR